MQGSKILLIRLSSAGDVTLASPLLRLIKQKEPHSEVHFVVRENLSDLLRYNPNITSIHLVQEHSGTHELEELRQRLIAEKFDRTLDLQNNFRSVYLRRGTARSISVVRKDVLKRFALVKSKLNFYSEIRSVSLKYAQVYDAKVFDVSTPEIFFPKDLHWKVDDVWREQAPIGKKSVALCPGSRHFTKRWPLENWVQLAGKLSDDYKVVLVGGEDDAEYCREIEKKGGAASFCGKFSMLESAALLAHVDVVVTNDSFLMHAANAVGRKIVAIFGSTVREFGFFPYGVRNRIMEISDLPCRPCSHVGRDSCPKGHFKCMLSTTPEMVYGATLELLTR